MKEDYKNIAEDVIKTSGKWNFLTVIFSFPLAIAMFMFVSVYSTMFGKTISQSGEAYSIRVTSVEYHLGIPGSLFGLLFLIFWGGYFLVYYMSRRKRFQAYKLSQIIFMLMLMLIPMYYSMFYAFQFFVPFLIIRILYWILFVASIIYIFYIIFTKKLKIFTITKEQRQIFTNILLLLWGISTIINFLLGDFNHFVARLLLSAMPVFPPLIIIVFIYVYRMSLSTFLIVSELSSNQEQYRQEFGYSIEEWYGKKSKMYKESLRKG